MFAFIIALLLSASASAKPTPQLTLSFLNESTSTERLEFYEKMVASCRDHYGKGHLGKFFEAPFYEPIVKEFIKQQKLWLQSIQGVLELKSELPIRNHSQTLARLAEQKELFTRLVIIGRDLLEMNLPYQSILRYARLHALAVSGSEMDTVFADPKTLWNRRETTELISESPKVFLIPLPFAVSAQQLNHWLDVPVVFLDLVPRKEGTLDTTITARFARSALSGYGNWFGTDLLDADPAFRLTGYELSEDRRHLLEERSREWKELFAALEKEGSSSEVELSHFLLHRWHSERALGARALKGENEREATRMAVRPALLEDPLALKKARARLHQAAQGIAAGNFASICISLFNDLDKQI